MARHRQKKPKLLGPDGKPWVAPPKPVAGNSVTLSYNGLDLSQTVTEITLDIGPYRSFLGAIAATEKPAKSVLADRVAEDLAALTADFDGVSVEEMPKPPADLTAYADAFASARKACPHTNAESTTYASREYYCPDCRRYVRDSDIKRGPFWFGS